MLRVGAPLVAAFCGGALSGCGRATEPVSIQPAWDNHFAGFGAGVGSKKDSSERKAALDKIMQDYDDKSIVSIWDVTKPQADNCKDKAAATCKQPEAEHNTPDAIRSMFDGLFESLQGCVEDKEGKLASKVKVVEPTASATGSVFLTWECKNKGFLKATDTFVFEGVMIRKQNIVVEMGSMASQSLWQPASLNQGPLAQDECNQQKPNSVQCAFDKFFASFTMGAKGSDAALNDVMLHYIEDSLVHLVVYPDGSKIPEFVEFKGLASVRAMYKKIFEDFTDGCNIATQLVEVTSDDGSAGKQVFLVWNLPASGTTWATDTFIFDDDFKIVKHNIVAVLGPKDTTGCPAPAPAPTPASLEVVV